MPQQELSAEQAKRDAHDAVRQARPWVERFGRVGYVSRGVVYALIGVLAAQAVFNGGETTGTQGALRELVQAPFGPVLLGALAIGLVGHALWRFIQAILDTERKGMDGKGIITRSAYGSIGLIYMSLAVSTILGGFLGVAALQVDPQEAHGLDGSAPVRPASIRGKVMQNVAPCPGRLSAQIRPPCSSIIPLAIANPKPEPP